MIRSMMGAAHKAIGRRSTPSETSEQWCCWRRRRRRNDYRTLNSSRFLPDAMSITSQRGILPLPDHVSEGLFGFRNFGWTLGYGRRFKRSLGFPPDLRPSSSSCFCSLRVSSFSLLDRTSMILWCSSQSASCGIFSRSLSFISHRQRERACRY